VSSIILTACSANPSDRLDKLSDEKVSRGTLEARQ
jgi:hypothetical protein